MYKSVMKVTFLLCYFTITVFPKKLPYSKSLIIKISVSYSDYFKVKDHENQVVNFVTWKLMATQKFHMIFYRWQIEVLMHAIHSETSMDTEIFIISQMDWISGRDLNPKCSVNEMIYTGTHTGFELMGVEGLNLHLNLPNPLFYLKYWPNW